MVSFRLCSRVRRHGEGRNYWPSKSYQNSSCWCCQVLSQTDPPNASSAVLSWACLRGLFLFPRSVVMYTDLASSVLQCFFADDNNWSSRCRLETSRWQGNDGWNGRNGRYGRHGRHVLGSYLGEGYYSSASSGFALIWEVVHASHWEVYSD